MIEDDTFVKAAKTNFAFRLVAGFIFGIFAAIVSFIFIIASFVTKKTELIVPLIIMAVVGLGVSASCGYFLFRKGKKEEDEKEKE